MTGGMDRDEELPISVRLALCPGERERDPSGCIRSIGPRGAGSAAASSSGVGTGVTTSTASPLLFPGLPLWWFRKSSGFYSCRPPHCQVDASSLVCLQHRRHTGADAVYPTDTSAMKLNNIKSYTLISTDTTDNSESINTVDGGQCRAGGLPGYVG